MATRKRRLGGPRGGGGGGPIGGGATATLIWLELAQKFREISDLYKKLAKTSIGGSAKPRGGGGGGPIGGG